MKRQIIAAVLLCVSLLMAGCSKESAASAAPEAAVEEVAENPVEKLDPGAVVGDYMDSTSQRAGMTVSYDENSSTYTFFVHWANSAYEEMTWTMHIVDNGSTKLSYDDCINEVVSYPEESEAFTEIRYDNGSGFFTYEDSKLLWNGAGDENCTACVFEKMQ